MAYYASGCKSEQKKVTRQNKLKRLEIPQHAQNSNRMAGYAPQIVIRSESSQESEQSRMTAKFANMRRLE